MITFRCSKCPATTTERLPRRWAAVLADEPGSAPKVLCVQCADACEEGWATEYDPISKEHRKVRRPFDLALSRF